MDKVAKGIPHFCNSKFPIIAKRSLKAPHQNNILVFERTNRLQGGMEDANNDPSQGYQKNVF
jgi:hypothetical protein